MIAASGHGAWVNIKALEAIGVVVRPTGYTLRKVAMGYVSKKKIIPCYF